MDRRLMCTPRDLLLQSVQLGLLNPVDRDLLLRALEPLVLGFAGRIGSGKSAVSKEVAKALGWPRAVSATTSAPLQEFGSR